MITVSVIQKNDKVRRRYLGVGSLSYFYYFQVHLFCLDTSTLFGHHNHYFCYSIDLVKELYFARSLFFSYICKHNLFTFHSLYKFFIAQTGEREKFPSTSDVEPFILEKCICLLVYFIIFTMNPCVTSITLNTVMIFCNRSIANFTGKFYYHFF